MRLLIALILLCTLASGVIAAERPQKAKAIDSPFSAAPAPPAAPAHAAPTILSIVPAQGEPGSKVSIFGSGFGPSSSVFLGTVEVTATMLDGRQIDFTIPQLDAGLYALYVKRSDGTSGRVYNFTVQAQRPVLASLSPDRVSACAQGGEREVAARGRNFTAGSMLLFDGAVIPSRLVSPEEVVFSVPQAAGGQHQVVIRNDQGDNASLPRALAVESRPEISQVSVGSEYVNYYELNIYGRNFQYNSSIVVDGQRIGGRGGEATGERDRLIYVDCTRMVYQRHPYSPVNKDFRIMVMNPGGESSQTVQVSAP